MALLQKQVRELGGGFGRMQHSLEHLAGAMERISELAGRLGFLLALLGGVPRSFAHGALPMFLFWGMGGRGGGSGPLARLFRGFGGGPGGFGPGGSRPPFFPPALTQALNLLYRRQTTLPAHGTSLG